MLKSGVHRRCIVAFHMLSERTDYRVFGPIALRAEGDYLRTKFFSSTQNNLRLSADGVFRFQDSQLQEEGDVCATH